MSSNLIWVGLLVGTLAVTTGASAAPPAAKVDPAKIEMRGHDAANRIYPERCSNGRNADEATRDAFVAKTLADPASKLGVARAQLVAESAETPGEVYVTPWLLVHNARPDGCSTTLQTWVGFLVLDHADGGRVIMARYQITLDDEVHDDERRLSIRSVKPVDHRSEARKKALAIPAR